jgi:cholesterol transport system auxiliary component
MMTFRTRCRPSHPAASAVRTRCAQFAVVLALPLALTGCGSPSAPTAGPSPSAGVGTNDPAWVTLRANLPAPDADRITYDEHSRTLTLYELPGNDRWMIQMHGDEGARPSGTQQRIPIEAPLAQVTVFYVRPGMKPSVAVSVQQIRDTGRAHNSLALAK